MIEKYNIRDTGISFLDVMKLISKGYDFDAILKECPKLTPEDIKSVIQTANSLLTKQIILDSYLSVDENLKKMLDNLEDIKVAVIDRNYSRWSDLEIKELSNLFKTGADISEISRILNRTEKEIKSKLKILKIMRGKK